MTKQPTLIYFASDIIKEFVRKNPIDWADRELANGPGNLLTPSPAMGVFVERLTKGKRLFAQQDYVDYAWESWDGWKQELTKKQIQGIEARLYRNFYPSAIDSIHVWALLVETSLFALCEIDIAEDAFSKTDLTVWSREGKKYKVALNIDSKYCDGWMEHKRSVRGAPINAIEIPLSMKRPRSPGNKRWYKVEDLEPLLGIIDNEAGQQIGDEFTGHTIEQGSII